MRKCNFGIRYLTMTYAEKKNLQSTHFSGCLRKMFVFLNLLDLTSCNISMIFAHFYIKFPLIYMSKKALANVDIILQ